MKKHFPAIFCILTALYLSLSSLNVQAQNVFISGKIKNIRSSQLVCYRKPNAIFSFVPPKRTSLIPISAKGNFSIETELYTPEEWVLQYETTKIALFIQPNEKMEIDLSLDKKGEYNFIIKGLHSKEQALRQKMYNIQKQKKTAFLSLEDSLFVAFPSWDEIEFDYTEIDKLDSVFLKFYETNSSYFPLYAKIRDKRIRPDSLFLHDSDAALYSPHYNACLMAYLKYHDTTGLTFSALAFRHPLILRFEIATQALSGKVRDAALSQIVATALSQNGWVGDSLYLRYQKIVYTTEFCWIIRTFVADYFRQLLAQKGKQTILIEKKYAENWQEIFTQYPNKILYVDIWQDHCRPCIYEMEKSLFWQKQSAYDSVAFVYLYLGKNKKRWKALAKKYNITGNHYFIKNSHNIEQWIMQEKGNIALPHYLIIDSKGTFINKNAPFPDREEWKSVMDLYLNQGQNGSF